MIDAKTALKRSKERQKDIVAQHVKWFMVRAELAIEKAVESGCDHAIVNAVDLRVEGIEQGMAELQKIGYKVDRIIGEVTVSWDS